MSEMVLSGLRAENPLAFLAALGALSLCGEGLGRELALDWRPSVGAWAPVLTGEGLNSRSDVVTAIESAHARRLQTGQLHDELGWEKDIMKVTRESARRLLRDRLDSVRPASPAAWLLAACVAELPLRVDKSSVSYTPLRLIPRVGRARFLEVALRESQAGLGHIEACLFERWTYSAGVQSLRWDPAALVPARALMAQAPTHLGTRGVAGAVLLAVRGLAFFPMMTVGASTRRQRAVPPGMIDRGRLIWPIWSGPLEPPLVRMLLSMRWLHALDDEDRTRREHAREQARAHGVVARFAAQRVSRAEDDEALGWGLPIALDESDHVSR